MRAAYLVLYEGEPADPGGFVAYYLDVHAPLLWAFPGIRGVEVHVRRGDTGPFLVTRLVFDSVDALVEAVEGPHRAITRRDMEENILPAFSGTVRHLITEVHTPPPVGLPAPPARRAL